MSLHYYIKANHLVPDVVGGSRLLCKGHSLGRLVSSSLALLITHCVFSGKQLPCLRFDLCSVNTGERVGEIRPRFSVSGELGSLGIMLETTHSALRTRRSHPHGMN